MEIFVVFGGKKTKPIQSQTKPIAGFWSDILIKSEIGAE